MKILGDNASKEFGLHAAIPTLPEPENGSTTKPPSGEGVVAMHHAGSVAGNGQGCLH